jgi:CheY-like chemotaxis protein/phosphoribosyl 1,2-cyclic phosphodiesterase
MRVHFWGTRGSIATPGPGTVRYGGNTPCVSARTDDGTLLIFDAGSGIRLLGLALPPRPLRAHIFIGHTHADHIQGLPFFRPLFLPGSHLTIYGPRGVDRSFPSAVGGQMDYAYFPVPMRDLESKIEFEELDERDLEIPGVHGAICVQAKFLNHTSPCLGYRVEADGAAFVYATDHEAHSATTWRADAPASGRTLADIVHVEDRSHAEFLKDADVVVHDAQYVAEEYPLKAGWGHSTVEYVTDIAVAVGVRRLVLFHHEPTRDDDGVDAVLERGRGRAAGTATDVIAASEGMELELRGTRAATRPAPRPAAAEVPRQARILVADDDASVRRLLEAALRGDGYRITLATNGTDALRLALEQRPDLLLLDWQMPGLTGLEVATLLRADERFASVPIVLVTGLATEDEVAAGFGVGITDHIAKPFAVSQVRARVRRWLAREPGAVPRGAP